MIRSSRAAFEHRQRARSRGVVLLALLLALALLSIGLMAAVDVWSINRQREREQQLLFVGDQYRTAIRHYYFAGPPGAGRTLPPSLEALLDDDRSPIPLHHLRRLYPDPITNSTDWGLLRVGERIMGVYSNSDAQPLKQAGFPPLDAVFADKTAYHDWVFAFVVPRRAGIGGATPPSAPPSAPSSSPPAFQPNINFRPNGGNPS